MRIVAAALLALLVAGSLAAQPGHDARFLLSAEDYPRSNYRILLVDPSGPSPSVSTLGKSFYGSYGMTMDADNRGVIYTEYGAQHFATRILRVEPGGAIYTVWSGAGVSSTLWHHLWALELDQDGDYVCVQQQWTVVSSKRHSSTRVIKVDRTTGAVTTLYNPISYRYQLPRGKLARDIDTGHWLWNTLDNTQSFPIQQIPVGKGHYGIWANASGFASYHLPQDHRTGCLLSANQMSIYQLAKGAGGPTTLATLSPRPYATHRACALDLQTAARPVMHTVADGYASTLNPPGYAELYTIDRTAWTVTSMTFVRRPGSVLPHDFAYYRGRHLQTVRVKPDHWEIRISCPRFAKKAYAIAASVTGVRPGAVLADGRRIHLMPDMITFATLAGWLPGVWSSGPGVLDTNGEARGGLDLRGIRPAGGFGMPLWIAVVVLDSAAPLGIAYLPDAFVMRI